MNFTSAAPASSRLIRLAPRVLRPASPGSRSLPSSPDRDLIVPRSGERAPALAPKDASAPFRSLLGCRLGLEGTCTPRKETALPQRTGLSPRNTRLFGSRGRVHLRPTKIQACTTNSTASSPHSSSSSPGRPQTGAVALATASVPPRLATKSLPKWYRKYDIETSPRDPPPSGSNAANCRAKRRMR